MKAPFATWCGVTQKRLIPGPCRHEALDGYLETRFHRKFVRLAETRVSKLTSTSSTMSTVYSSLPEHISWSTKGTR